MKTTAHDRAAFVSRKLYGGRGLEEIVAQQMETIRELRAELEARPGNRNRKRRLQREIEIAQEEIEFATARVQQENVDLVIRGSGPFRIA